MAWQGDRGLEDAKGAPKVYITVRWGSWGTNFGVLPWVPKFLAMPLINRNLFYSHLVNSLLHIINTIIGLAVWRCVMIVSPRNRS